MSTRDGSAETLMNIINKYAEDSHSTRMAPHQLQQALQNLQTKVATLKSFIASSNQLSIPGPIPQGNPTWAHLGRTIPHPKREKKPNSKQQFSWKMFTQVARRFIIKTGRRKKLRNSRVLNFCGVLRQNENLPREAMWTAISLSGRRVAELQLEQECAPTLLSMHALALWGQVDLGQRMGQIKKIK
ncbi:hypothetical protein VTP01DRAFT_2926 [Rhizomucor pusillus]|uniref:uncharacterized protein n=1 Tax=Rhizomucor pusillus TaxID=4840 RepID=UPI0037422570